MRATVGASAGLFMNGVPHQNCIVVLGSGPRASALVADGQRGGLFGDVVEFIMGDVDTARVREV
ncbi:MAG TPA: hypothetical protein PKI02_03415 [Mycobacterium sp.]|nr:hypothetical protein [Mycobacterium sp.]